MNYFAHGVAFLDRPYLLAGTAVPDWLLVADRQVRVRSRQIHAWFLRSGLDGDQRHSAIGQVAQGILQHLADDQQFHRSQAFREFSFLLSQQVGSLLDEEALRCPKRPGRPPELSHLPHFGQAKHANPSIGQTTSEATSAQPSTLPNSSGGFDTSFVGHLLVELLLDAALIAENPARLDHYYRALDQVDIKIILEAVHQITARRADRLATMILEFRRLRILWDYLDDRKLLTRLNQVMRRVGLVELPPALLDLLPSARQQVASRTKQLLAGLPTETLFEKR
ncbi:MAG: hypothetical protein NZ602_07190 [Thermoguttaceae bacterium]|nr:hypothetical protein [Thermoguttaceae bacterium]MDW8038159.1 hypothetical protein [Thermoguttaceae bacterium]